MDEEVTAAHAAQLTWLSERTIRRRIAANELPARHIARNRYAIRVQDLPIRRPADELMSRLQALEYRVRVLELPQQRVLALLDPAVATGAVERGLQTEPEMAMELGDFLTQLANEVLRLRPPISAASSEPRRHGRPSKVRPSAQVELAADS